MIKELAPLAKKNMRISITIEGGDDGVVRVLLLCSSTRKNTIPSYAPLVKVLKGTDYQEIERRLIDAEALSKLNEKVGVLEASFNEAPAKAATEKSSAAPQPAESPAAPAKRGRKPKAKDEAPAQGTQAPQPVQAQLDLEQEIKKSEDQEAIDGLKKHLGEMDANLLLGDPEGLAKWLTMAKAIKTDFAAHLQKPWFTEIMAEVYEPQKAEYKKKAQP